MAKWIQGGVEAPHNRSKKALKEAVAADPSAVEFYSTSAVRTEWSGAVADMPEEGENVKLTVVGPNPYTARKWYATIARGKDGQIKVT